ncbi:hypothetical protein MTO96_026326 [Rhipicephalus appendiculatus]
MMELTKVLAVVAFLASSCAAMVYRRDVQCDFTDVNIDDEVFSRLIARLPESLESGPEGYHTLFPGIEVGRQTFEGLNKLRQFGPAIPYCTNGARMVQVDFYSDGDARSWSPWKICSDDQVFSRLIAKLPDAMEIGPQCYNRLLPELQVGGPTFYGLNELRQFRSAIMYCTSGSRVVQGDLYRDAHAHFSSAWKTCSGDEGRLSIRPMLTRFTVQFHIDDSTPAGLKLEFDLALPAITKNFRNSVTRAGKIVHLMAFEFISVLLRGILQELWGAQFFSIWSQSFLQDG